MINDDNDCKQKYIYLISYILNIKFSGKADRIEENRINLK